MILILATQSKDIIYGLRNLLNDLGNESEVLNDYARKNMILNELINIILIKTVQLSKEYQIALLTGDLLLSFSKNGVHYTKFIQEISGQENLKLLMEIVELFIDRNDVLEKLSVILQRISFHS